MPSDPTLESDALQSYLRRTEGATSRELVGALNEVNSTEGIGYEGAWNTYHAAASSYYGAAYGEGY